jgi:hypothetical protein
MAEAQITTLSEFLRHSGAKYRVFDMGRRVEKLSATQFEQFELAEIPYPNPFQRTALFGVIFWHPKTTQQHYVWFLRLPLDEQGLLVQAARDEFLVTVLDRVGECMLAAADGQLIQGALKDSPYSFNPREDRMAAFNAQATYTLGLPASPFFDDAQRYFAGKLDASTWTSLGMQGVADVAIRIESSSEKKNLLAGFAALPAPPQHMLSTFLENVETSVEVVEHFASLLRDVLAEQNVDVSTITAYLRAVSHTSAEGLLKSLIREVLSHPVSQQIEVMAVMSGRCWEALQDEALCQQYIERLVDNEAGYEGFSHLVADLIYMPKMRHPVMQALRNPQRSANLGQFVGQLFGHA